MPLDRDLTDPRAIVLKGMLFVVLGVLASAGVVAPSLGVEIDARIVAGLHVLGVWAFCRAYYFAFYVIGKYVDPGFRFAGLWSAARWMLRSGITRRRG